MKVFYSRKSTAEQNEIRQLQNTENFDYVFVDSCSGSVPLFERPKGSQIKEMLDNKQVEHIEIHSIDRIGRNTVDVLQNWQYFTELGVKVVCRNPNLTNFKSDGTPDEVSAMIISILSIMASYEKSQIRQRQLEGVALAKQRGVYRGRKINTKESKDKFISKPRNQKILNYLNKGYKFSEISEIVKCSYSTIHKVKKVNAELSLN
jgi:DNA invertase Pin-like site-specific DNA recombinase